MNIVDEMYLETLEQNYNQLQSECKLLARLACVLLTRHGGCAIISQDETDAINEAGYLDVTYNKEEQSYEIGYSIGEDGV